MTPLRLARKDSLRDIKGLEFFFKLCSKILLLSLPRDQSSFDFVEQDGDKNSDGTKEAPRRRQWENEREQRQAVLRSEKKFLRIITNFCAQLFPRFGPIFLTR